MTSITRLTMRDSTNPFDIPLDNLAAVAGYGDGLYQWVSEGWARFQPPIVPLSIVVNPADQGDILDVETGAATPADTPGWANRFQRPGRRLPTIYCNRNTIGQVRFFMDGRPFDWWAATLDGTVDVPGAVAVQYCGAADSNDPCRTTGHYDESVILDPGWIGQGGDPAMDPTLEAKLDAVLNILLSGSDNRAANPWITGELSDLRMDLAELMAAVKAIPGGTDTATILAAIERIEKALQGA